MTVLRPDRHTAWMRRGSGAGVSYDCSSRCLSDLLEGHKGWPDSKRHDSIEHTASSWCQIMCSV